MAACSGGAAGCAGGGGAAAAGAPSAAGTRIVGAAGAAGVRIVGAVTIGQAPRVDITADGAAAPDGCRLIQAGALDDVSDFAALEPEPGDAVLVSRLRDGRSVRLAERKVLPLLQRAIGKLEGQGAGAIMVWCSGQMPDTLHAGVPLLFAHRAERAAVQALGISHLAVVLPDAAQIPKVSAEWRQLVGRVDAYSALPYASDAAAHSEQNPLVQVARAIAATDAQAVVLDCMGYSSAMKDLVARECGKPVLIPRALLAALAAQVL